MDLSAIFGIVAIVGGGVGVFIATAQRGVYSTLKDSNEELRAQIKFIADQHKDDLDRAEQRHTRELTQLRERLHESERQCAKDLGELRGQVQTLQSKAIQEIVDGVATAIEQTRRES